MTLLSPKPEELDLPKEEPDVEIVRVSDLLKENIKNQFEERKGKISLAQSSDFKGKLASSSRMSMGGETDFMSCAG